MNSQNLSISREELSKVIAPTLDSDEHQPLDSRRKLEDRLEEIRLMRELKEFDFDLV